MSRIRSPHLRAILHVIKPIVSSTPLKTIKWTLVFLSALNYRSFPGSWHFRSLLPLYKRWFLYMAIRARMAISFKSQAQTTKYVDDWLDSLHPVGKNPFEVQSVYRSFASLDECDFNLHLSNSSYAKTLDRARLDAAVMLFTNFVRAGSMIPLGGTHFHYIREIPILSSYEVRTSIGSWDDKWIYVISKFVSHPKKGSQKANPPSSKTPPSDITGLMHAPISTPVDEFASASDTPRDDSYSPKSKPTDLKALVARLAATPELDGATLHTVCVSEFCLKIGRITIPPAVLLASSGFTGAAPNTYSPSNPPPHWETAKKMIYVSSGGSIKSYREFLKGGWKQDRWWKEALSGVEEQRKAKLEVFGHLRNGMDGTRAL